MKVKVLNAHTQVEIRYMDLQDSLNRNSECLLGRSPNSGLILESVDVSRLHAKFAWEREQYFFYDLGSVNGSLLNGTIAQANQGYLLKPGDIIRIGEFVLMLEAIDPQPEDLPATVIGDPDATVVSGRDLNALLSGQESAQIAEWVKQASEAPAAPQPDLKIVSANETDLDSPLESLDSLSSADLLLKDNLWEDSPPSFEEPSEELSTALFENVTEELFEEPLDVFSELAIESPPPAANQIELPTDVESEIIESEQPDFFCDQTVIQLEASQSDVEDTSLTESVAEFDSTVDLDSDLVSDSISVQPDDLDGATMIQLDEEKISFAEQISISDPVMSEFSTQSAIEAVSFDSTDPEIQSADAIELSEASGSELLVALSELALREESLAPEDAAIIGSGDVDSSDVEELDLESPQLMFSPEPAIDETSSEWGNEVEGCDRDSNDSEISHSDSKDLSSVDQLLAEQIALSATAAVLLQSEADENASLDSSDTFADEHPEAEVFEDTLSAADIDVEETSFTEIEDAVVDELTELKSIEATALSPEDGFTVNTEEHGFTRVEESIIVDVEDSVASAGEANLINEDVFADEEDVAVSIQEDIETGVETGAFIEADSEVVEVTGLAPEITSPEVVQSEQHEAAPEVNLKTSEIPESASNPASAQSPSALVPPSVLQEKYIVLLAHESQEIDLIHLVERYRSLLSCCQILTTPAISEALKQQIGFSVSQQTLPLLQGGYQFVNGLITANKILAVLFIRDFLTPQPTQANDDALSRSCNVYQVLLASNLSTAEAIVSYLQTNVAFNSFSS